VPFFRKSPAGIDFFAMISQTCPVLVLTMFDNGDLAMLAMKRGAKGFVSKSESPRLLLTAIDTIRGILGFRSLVP